VDLEMEKKFWLGPGKPNIITRVLRRQKQNDQLLRKEDMMTEAETRTGEGY
jgi:hypothetical protein